MFTWHSWMLFPLLGFCGQSQDKNITKELLTMNVVSVHPASVLSLYSLTYLTLVCWRKGYNEDALSLLFLLLGPHLFFSPWREISMRGLCWGGLRPLRVQHHRAQQKHGHPWAVSGGVNDCDDFFLLVLNQNCLAARSRRVSRLLVNENWLAGAF